MTLRGLLPMASAAAAIVVCAWFGLGIVQATSLQRAEAIIISSARSSPLLGHTATLLTDASFLNPDQAPQIERSALLLKEGHERAARRLAEAVTRAEPQNIEAWVAVARASSGDPVSFYTAAIHVRELEPRFPK